MRSPLSIARRAGLVDTDFEPVAAITRGSLVESVHRGVVAVVDSRGRIRGTAGASNSLILMRSSAKPFQALAVVESGTAEAFSLTAAELAIMCGSHSGRKEHVEVVAGLLDRLGIAADSLVCGSLKHMCSGKHAGMIAMARHLGVPIEGYEKATHPVQRRIVETILGLLNTLPLGDGESRRGRPRRVLLAGVDGCGVPLLRVTIRDAGYLYALLAAGATEGLARLRDAMMEHPELVAGEGCLDTNLMRDASGRLISKSGAEGIQALALAPGAAPGIERDVSIGCMIKIEDGSSRVLPALAGAFLSAYGIPLSEEAFAGRNRSPEALRGLALGKVIPIVEGTAFRHSRADQETLDGHLVGDEKLSVCVGMEKEIVRFLRDEWPVVDEETFGRPLTWVSEPYALVVRRRRRVLAVLRGHFIGGVASVDELMVARGLRGEGLGSRLLGAFEEEARARGCLRIVLRAVKSSPAEDFYYGRGYSRQCVEWLHEFGYDYVRLTRELRAED